MTTETTTDLSKSLATAKGNETKAMTAVQNAAASGDVAEIGKSAAALAKATKARESVEKAILASEGAKWTAQVQDNTETVRVAVNSDALHDAMEGLRKASIKRIEIELDGDGVYLVSTKSGQRGRQPGTTSKRETYEVNGITFSAGELIKMVGPTMPNHDERLTAIADKQLTRKDYAREITEANDGTVVENS